MAAEAPDDAGGAGAARLLRQATKGASILMSGQASSRIVSFAGNVVLVRLMGADALGVSSVQLHLLQSTCLGLTREGVRRAVLRDPHASPEMACSLAKTYALGGLIALLPIAVAYFVSQPPPAGFSAEVYLFAIILVGISVIIELASEPLYVVAQAQLRYSVRSSLEALGSLARVFASLTAHLIAGWQLEAFAAGYVASSATLLVGYIIASGRPELSMALSAPLHWSYKEPTLAHEALAMSLQAAWKLVLAEGEGLILLALGTTTPAEQGAYALAASLGALVARLILQPCEEAAYTVFGRLKPGAELDRALGGLVRAFGVFGLFFACLGSQFCHFLIRLLYGVKWANDNDAAAPRILAIYAVYVGFLAVNGMSEAYVQAVMDPREMSHLSVWLGVCSLVFVALAAALVPELGTLGLLVANCIVMTMRITRNIWFAKVKRKSNARFLPPVGVILAFAGAWWTARLSRLHIYHDATSLYAAAAHVGVGGLAGLCVVATIYLTDRELVMLLRDMVVGKP